MKLQEKVLSQPSCTYEVNVSDQLNHNYSTLIHNIKCNLSNVFAGSLNFLLDRIKIGDILEFDNQLGKVINQSMYNTTIETSRGRKIEIPNARIGESKTIRYKDKGQYNPDLNFKLIDQSYVDKAKNIVIGIMRSSTTFESKNSLTNTVYVNQDRYGNAILTPFCYSKNNDTWTSLWSMKNEMTLALKKAGCIR